jgi:membrane protein implicated in regulation of membrane protease activity
MFTIRKWISNLFTTYSKKTNSNITDQIVTALEQINPNETGKGELLGTIWNVRNDTKSIIQKDSKNKVKQIEGVTLIIGE